MVNTRDRIEFNEADLKEVNPTPALNLPDLKVLRCLSPRNGEPYMVFDCIPAHPHNKGCTACGSIDIIKHGTVPKKRIIHDINVGLTRIDLMVLVPRYRCKDCGAVFSHVFDCAPEGRHLTYRLHEQLRRDVFLRPFKQVASEYGYSEGTIRNIFDEYAAELEAARGPIIAPEVLGIDEKHIVHEMRGIFVDIKTGRLLEMTAQNKESDIIGTIEKMVDYDKNIKIVTTDMSYSYRSYIADCLPYAKHIIDKYHVFQELSRKVTRVKTTLMERLNTRIKGEEDPQVALHLRDVRDLLVRNAYLFKFGREKLLEKPNRIRILADVCNTFPEFNHLRLLKEGFERIYDASTRSDAEHLYDEWTKLVPPIGVRKIASWEEEYGVQAELFSEFRVFYRTTTKWHKEIFNYFDPGCQFTNAAAEGTNSLIQRINGMGSGYGFSHLRAKALFWHLSSTRYTYTLKTTITDFSYDYSRTDFSRTDYMDFSMPKRRVEIIRNTEQAPMREISVYSFIPQDAEYYDFDDE